MARASKRLEVLEAIVSIIERDGLTAVTLDAVALETGMTRAGLLYHFPSREALILATHEHLTRSWEQELEASAGNTSDRATDAERHAAVREVHVDHQRRDLHADGAVHALCVDLVEHRSFDDRCDAAAEVVGPDEIGDHVSARPCVVDV